MLNTYLALLPEFSTPAPPRDGNIGGNPLMSLTPFHLKYWGTIPGASCLFDYCAFPYLLKLLGYLLLPHDLQQWCLTKHCSATNAGVFAFIR